MLKTLTGAAPIVRQGQKCACFDPKIWIFGAKSEFLVLESGFLSTGHITSTPGAKTLPFQTAPKNFRFQAMGQFLGLTPVFGHFGPFPIHYNKYH